MLKNILIITVLIFITCSNPASNPDPPLVGDINANEIAYEIADAVLYSNYFFYGDSVFIKNPIAQTLNSDVNQNGNYLTVADLQYQFRVIVGDALPYPKLRHNTSIEIEINSDVYHTYEEIGAAFLIVEGNQIPKLFADGMNMSFNFDGINTRILIHSGDGNSFSSTFLGVKGNLLYYEFATPEGAETIVTINQY